MASLTITVPGAPVSWQRPRAISRPGCKPHFFEAQKVKTWRTYVREKAIEAMNGRPMLGGDPKHKVALQIGIVLALPRPGRLYRKKDFPGPVWSTEMPDWDNLAKGIIDALQGIVFANDSLIAAAHIFKIYHSKDEKPKTVIQIDELDKSQGAYINAY